jgi:hypothetical protein
MTTGYLWTGQYEEAKLAIEGDGRPHSMELDNDTLDGKWSQDLKTGIDFFIINDAIFSKLCILGEDVEPCFEGSSVTKPEVSKTFSKIDDDFKNTLFTMMQDLKFALQGGKTMANVNTQATVEENAQVTAPTGDFSATQGKDEQNVSNENQNFTEGSSTENVAVNTDANSSTEFEKKDDKEEEKKDTSDNSEGNDDEDKEKDKKYTLLEEKFTALEQKYSAMEKDYQSLLEFKNNVDNEKKDALINSFYMLSDEDKKEVIDNKSKYSLEDIEAKLSVICFRKKVSFEDTKETEQKTETQSSVTTYSLNSAVENDVPAWVQACRNTQNKNK